MTYSDHSDDYKKGFTSGSWDAFNQVLNFINTLEDGKIEKN